MKLGLSEKQYNHLLTLISEIELGEQSEPPPSEPEAGTSDKQAGGQGYPQVSKWESGATRGPGNQVGVTKWSEVVGSKLTRGKANQLTEQTSKDNYGNEYDSFGNPITFPHYDKNGRYVKSEFKNVDIQKYTPEFWLGRSVPEEPKIVDTSKDKDQLRGLYYNKLSGTYEKPAGSETPKWSRYERPGDVEPVARLISVNNKFYREDLNNWYIGNMGITLSDMENFQNRKTNSGLSVPKGFSPSRYDEYLSKYKVIKDKIISLEEKHSFKWNPLKPMGKLPWDKKDLGLLNQLNQQLIDLEKEYKSQKFSYGIDEKSLEQYNLIKKNIDDMFLSRIKQIQIKGNQKQQDKKQQDNVYVSKNIKIPTVLDSLKSEYKKRLGILNKSFGMDDWSKNTGMFGQDFDEWWDKWGTFVQIGGNIVFIALSGGIAAIIEGGLAIGAEAIAIELTTTGLIRAASPYVMDALFNASVGAYQVSRKQDEEGLISLVCALVPFVSFGANIGKVSIKSSQDLAFKIANSDLSDFGKFNSFINTLTEEEKRIFRDIYNLPRQSIKEGLGKIVKNELYKAKLYGIEIPKSSFSTWGKALAKTVALEAGLPFAAAVSNALFQFIKDDRELNFSQSDLRTIRQILDKNLKSINPKNALYVSDKVVDGVTSGKIKNVTDIQTAVMTFKAKKLTDKEIDDLNLRYSKKWGITIPKN